MAVQQKHGERHGRMGFENDFTTDQGQRFTEVANNAVKRRIKKREVEAPFVHSAKESALKTVTRAKWENRSRVRQVVWIIVIGLVSLWAMYMAG
ncbi:hypothetical protein ACNO7T_01760 [Vibrio campbellii]